jgi:hypothetical protein
MGVARLVLEFIQALIWPVVTLVSLFTLRKPIVGILNRIRKAELPGGVSLDIGEQIAVAHELAGKAQASVQHKHAAPTLPLTEANTRMVHLGLQPTPSGLDLDYYHQLTSVNPSLALAGLRLEIEIIVRNLIRGFKLELNSSEPVRRLLDRLLAADAITADQNEFLRQILSICYEAIHTQSISRDRATAVIDLAGTLLDDYLAWLEWGFPNQ